MARASPYPGVSVTPRKGPLHLVAAVPEVAVGLLADAVEPHIDPLVLELDEPALGHPDDVRVVAAGQATIGRDDQHAGGATLAAFEQRVGGSTGGGTDVADDLDQLVGVGLGGLDPGLSLDDAGRRDQLHRRRDLHRRLDAANAPANQPELSAGHLLGLEGLDERCDGPVELLEVGQLAGVDDVRHEPTVAGLQVLAHLGVETTDIRPYRHRP